MSSTNETSRDRHRDLVQMKAWVPADLKTEFVTRCKLQDASASDVLRGLMVAFVAQAAERRHG